MWVNASVCACMSVYDIQGDHVSVKTKNNQPNDIN